MALEHEREVIIRLKLDVDKGQSANASAEIKRVTGDATAQAEKASRAVSASTTKAVKEVSSATDQAMAKAQRQSGLARRQAEQLGREFNALLSGVVQFSRGVAVAFALSEKQSEKLARTVAGIWADFEILRGAITIVTQLSKVMRAYDVATRGAAAAQAALAVAQGASGVTGGAAAGGVALRPLGRNVAGFSLGRTAGTVASSAGGAAVGAGALKGGGALAGALKVGGAVAAPVAIAAAATAVIGGVVAVFSKNFRSLLFEAFDGIGKDERLKEAFSRNIKQVLAEAATSTRLAQIGSAKFRARLQFGGLDPGEAIAEASTLFRSITADPKGGSGPRGEAIGQIIAATKAIEEAEKARGRFALERLQTVRNEARVVQQIFEKEVKRADVIRKSRVTAAEGFGQLNPLQQQRLIRTKQKADAGLPLTRQERADLRGVGLESTTAIARRGDIAAAAQAGFFGAFGAEDRAKENRIRQQAAQKRGHDLFNLNVDFQGPLDKTFRNIDVSFQEGATAIAAAVERKVQVLRKSMQFWTIRQIDNSAASREQEKTLQGMAVQGDVE